LSDLPRIGYVCKRYPRYSETFIVTEILAHEEAGLDLEIFSLLPPNDTHFQDTISQVKAPLTYLGSDSVKASELWETITDAANDLPGLWSALSIAAGEDARDVHQAVLLAQAVKKRGIRHLHAHFASSAAGVARMAAHIAGVTYSITAHAKDIFHESVVPAELERKLRDAAAVVTISRLPLIFSRL